MKFNEGNVKLLLFVRERTGEKKRDVPRLCNCSRCPGVISHCFSTT